ncbi:uncharacterized protein LOC142347929 [Convolutriloba macropyga]|uniref:uncharacterized protein LOC142347929 n=1 Tax=Convolutriloba macropyga TaxID=536237 RepID=UPI003F5282F8
MTQCFNKCFDITVNLFTTDVFYLVDGPPDFRGGPPPRDPYPPPHNQHPGAINHETGPFPPEHRPGAYPEHRPGPYPPEHRPEPYPPEHRPGPYPPEHRPGPYPPEHRSGPYPLEDRPGPYPEHRPGPYPPEHRPEPYPLEHRPGPYPLEHRPGPYPLEDRPDPYREPRQDEYHQRPHPPDSYDEAYNHGPYRPGPSQQPMNFNHRNSNRRDGFRSPPNKRRDKDRSYRHEGYDHRDGFPGFGHQGRGAIQEVYSGNVTAQSTKQYTSFGMVEKEKPKVTAPKDKPFECEVCQKKFTTATGAEQHKANAHPENTDNRATRCEVCAKVFLTYHQYYQHRITAHEFHGEAAGVRTSGVVEPQKLKVKKPRASMPAPRDARDGYLCNQCNKVFPKYIGYVTHVRAKHNQLRNVHVCKNCDSPFYSLRELNNHFCVYPENTEIFQCPDCDVKMTSQEKYEKHWHFTHNKHNLFNCEICKKPFLEHSAYTQHKEAHKPGDEDRYTLLCNFCDQRFDRAANVEIHMKKYHNNESTKVPKVCNRCYCDYNSTKVDVAGLCDKCVSEDNEKANQQVAEPNSFPSSDFADDIIPSM